MKTIHASLILAFTFITSGVSAQAPFFSDSFENWEDLENGYTQPEGWFTSNVFSALFLDPQGIEQSTDSYSGTYAAYLGITSNGITEPTGSFMNKTAAVNGTPIVLTAWIKSNLNDDTISFISRVFQYDFQQNASTAFGVLEAEISTSMSEFTFVMFNYEFQMPGTADTARIIISYSDLTPNADSWFIIDDLQLDLPEGINETGNLKLPVYPNPASDQVSFYISEPMKNAYLELFDIIGKKVYIQNNSWNTGTHSIQLNGITPGVYQLKITDKTGKIMSSRLILQ